MYLINPLFCPKLNYYYPLQQISFNLCKILKIMRKRPIYVASRFFFHIYEGAKGMKTKSTIK